MGNFSRKRWRLRSARCGQLQRTLIISSFLAYNTGKKDPDLGSTLWASVENFERVSLEFTGCWVSGSRTLLGLRVLIRCLCLDQMSLKFTGFRVAVLGLYWVVGYRQKNMFAFGKGKQIVVEMYIKNYNLRSDYLSSYVVVSILHRQQ